MCTTPGKQEEAESSLTLGEPKPLPTQPARGTAVHTHRPLKGPGEHAPGRVGKQKGSLGFQQAVVAGGSGERQEGGTAYKSGLGHGGEDCSVQADGGDTQQLPPSWKRALHLITIQGLLLWGQKSRQIPDLMKGTLLPWETERWRLVFAQGNKVIAGYRPRSSAAWCLRRGGSDGPRAVCSLEHGDWTLGTPRPRIPRPELLRARSVCTGPEEALITSSRKVTIPGNRRQGLGPPQGSELQAQLDSALRSF